MFNLEKLGRKLLTMAKRGKKMGKSVRHGNQPAPYTKYGKKPYRYSQNYYAWKYGIVNKVKASNKYAEVNKKEYA